MDAEALAVYQQLALGPLEPTQRLEVDGELKVLQAKVEEPDTSVLQAIHAHLDEAKRAFFANQFGVAAEEYSLAYALKRLPRLLFNAAQACRRSGRVELAYLLYQRFLDDDPEAVLKKEVSAYLTELRPLAFRPPVYRRPWFWAVVGASAAVLAAGVGLGVGLARRQVLPSTDGPYFDVTFGLAIVR